VSVIVPVYNDPYGLKDTLNSLIVQDFLKQNYEIIISDNGSNNNTLDIVRMFAKIF